MPDLSRSLLGSAATIISKTLETKGADLLCQPHKVLRAYIARAQVFLPSNVESHLLLAYMRSAHLPLAEPQSAGVPIIWSPC
jgi:hypothetical protein